AKIQPTKWDWDPNSAITDGYDPCAALSWSIVTVHSATSSSARQIVLFNRGEYIGTATAEAYGFQPTITRAGDHTINVIYHYPKPGESNIIYTGEAHATFTSNEATQSVDMAGEVPPTYTARGRPRGELTVRSPGIQQRSGAATFLEIPMRGPATNSARSAGGCRYSTPSSGVSRPSASST